MGVSLVGVIISTEVFMEDFRYNTDTMAKAVSGKAFYGRGMANGMGPSVRSHVVAFTIGNDSQERD